MDPEVLETKPGPCRICGMALEPRTVTLADDGNPELEDMTRRFRVSLALTVPLLWPRRWARCSPGTSSIASSRRPPKAGSSCFSRRPSSSGAGGRSSSGWERASAPADSTCSPSSASAPASRGSTAWPPFSLPGVFPASFRGHDGAVGRYFESAAVIVTLVLHGPGARAAGARHGRAARSRRSSRSPRRPPGASPPTAPRRTSRSTTSGPATACASAPARRCRWTASSSRGRRASTSR